MGTIERGLYAHYKGGVYFVHGVVYHSESQEPFVHYECPKTGKEWIRPFGMFMEEVKITVVESAEMVALGSYKSAVTREESVPRFRCLKGEEPFDFFKGDNGGRFAHIGVQGKLIFLFSSGVAAEHFKTWLCGSGEQQYWEWMKVRESEENGPITAVSFDYHTGTNHVRAEQGRLTPEWDDDDE